MIFAWMVIIMSLIHTTYAESSDGIKMPADHDEKFQNAKPAGMPFPDESDKVYQSEAKRLDDYQRRLQKIEYKLKICADEEDSENDEEINRLYNHEKRLRNIELQLARITSNTLEYAKKNNEQFKTIDDFDNKINMLSNNVSKKLDDHEISLQKIEQVLKRHSSNISKVADIQDIKILSKPEIKDQPREVSNIKPIKAFQISTHRVSISGPLKFKYK